MDIVDPYRDTDGWQFTPDRPGCTADTVNMDHIKEHYYTTHPDVNPKRIIPVGPAPDFEQEHDRHTLAGGPPDDWA
jgi:glutathionyl-hydroquinone reductase